jgi:hypothetical protein
MNGDSRDMPGHRPVVVPTTTDSQRLARERVGAIDRRCRIARMADELAPLAVFYGPRWPRPVPLGRFLVEGWWAA